MAQLVKNLPAMQETWVWSLGREDALEKGKDTHSGILAWIIPWTVRSMGSQRVRHDWATYTHTLTHLLTYEMSAIVWQCEHSLALPFFGIGIKTDPFQSCGHYWVFQICWHIECSILTASSFRIWNSSAGITSLPLDLFVCSLWAHIYM